MRKLLLQMMTTIDGYVAGPEGDMGWATMDWDPPLRDRVLKHLEGVDCILMAMGRHSKMQFIPYWASVAENPNEPFFEYGKKLTSTPKVVLSNTLPRSEWPGTTLVSGNVVEETGKLKKLAGGDIIVFGGAMLAASLLRARLVDDIHLLVNPVAIGRGLRIFDELEAYQGMRLAGATSYRCGIVWLHYQPTTPTP